MCRNPLHCIVPPQILNKLLQHKDPQVRLAAQQTIVETARLRGQREILAQLFAPLSGGGGLHRSIYDAQHKSKASGKLVRDEGRPSAKDRAVNEVYTGFGATYDLYKKVFGRDSIDNKGMRLDGVVHYGKKFNNAFWNGARMIFGDGDGKIFTSFTGAIDVIGHELTHGVTEFTCALAYENQSGALNESMSDVFGSLVKQHFLKQTAAQADWLIGAGILGPALKGVALRSMKAPGTAYDGDDQPATMDGYQDLPNTDAGDFGGVHTNSGIPNHAFYLLATDLGGNAWEDAGQIWYDTLLALQTDSDFQACAATSFQVAGQRFGPGSAQQAAVADAWTAVGVKLSKSAAGPVSIIESKSADVFIRSKLEEIATELQQAMEAIRA